MEIKIFWEWEETKELINRVNISIDELWLNDFITLSTTTDETLKTELNISKEPALIIVEESIDFKDMIFEWIVPDIEELKSMFISIIWWWESSWGCSSWSCWSCGSSC
jgi:hypothetical protein